MNETEETWETAEMMRILDNDSGLLHMVRNEEADDIEDMVRRLATECDTFKEIDFDEIDWDAVADGMDY